jgi:hypothetical protein
LDVADLRARHLEKFRGIRLGQFLARDERAQLTREIDLRCEISRFLAAEPEILENVALGNGADLRSR